MQVAAEELPNSNTSNPRREQVPLLMQILVCPTCHEAWQTSKRSIFRHLHLQALAV